MKCFLALCLTKGILCPVYLDEAARRLLRKIKVCFVDLEKAFFKVPRTVFELAMMKKGMPEVLVRSVMNLYDGSKDKSLSGF